MKQTKTHITQKQRPLVSVIMPVYNAGKFLVPAIESIIKQSYPRMELIIVDDASTDDSWHTIKQYRKRYPKLIRSYRVDKQTNSAGNGAMNFGLLKAKGEYIARMDSDDVSDPKRIEKQVAYLLSHPAVILLGTQAHIIDGKGKKIGEKTMPTTHEKIYEQFGLLHPIIHPSVMIRRSLLPNPNKIYAMKWDVNDDYYTFFRLLNQGYFANLPEYLLKYRIHGKNLSLTKPKEKFKNSIAIRLEATRALGYRLSLTNMVLMFVQYILVSLMPSRLIVPVYMMLRGMKQNPQKYIVSWTKKLPWHPRFVSAVKKYYTYT